MKNKNTPQSKQTKEVQPSVCFKSVVSLFHWTPAFRALSCTMSKVW